MGEGNDRQASSRFPQGPPLTLLLPGQLSAEFTLPLRELGSVVKCWDANPSSHGLILGAERTPEH